MVYFDNAATSFPKPDIVYAEMDKCARNYAINVGRGQYPLAEKATQIVEKTRKKILDFFKCKDGTLIFSASATIAMNQVLNGLNYSKIKNIYITPFEHNAVLRTLNYLKDKFNFKIHYLKVQRHPFEYDQVAIENQFLEYPPDLLIVSHASNVCGAVVPIDWLFKLSKQYGAINILDSAQTAGVININMSTLLIDFLIFAGHKSLLGPFGSAGFLINYFNYELTPFIYGGTGYDSKNPYMPKQLPSRLEAGSLNMNAIVGLSAAIDWINEKGIETIYNHEQKLRSQFINLIKNFDEISIIGDSYVGDTVGVISIKHEDYSPDELGYILGKNGVCVRSGLQCAPKAHTFFGTFPSGTVRFSFSVFNELQEIDSLSMLEEVL